MIRNTISEFQDNKITIQEIIISSLLDEFMNLYTDSQLSSSEMLDYLDFINTLFRLKHKYLLDFHKEKRHFSRNTQIYHLKKIRAFAKLKIRKVTKVLPRKKYEPTEEVTMFRDMIKSLNKKIKQDISARTKALLDELMRERWTVQDKTALLKEILSRKSARFEELLESKDSEEIVTSFLALLDMKRRNEVIVIQSENFGEMIIKKEDF